MIIFSQISYASSIVMENIRRLKNCQSHIPEALAARSSWIKWNSQEKQSPNMKTNDSVVIQHSARYA